MNNMIRAFGELTVEQQPAAGGKGRTLAQLYQAGYPVPDGFVILPGAFDGDSLKPEAWQKVQDHLARVSSGDQHAAYAVRSSALSEDSAIASFAGEFETVLDVHSIQMIREAIHTVRQSRHSERVRAYSEAQEIDTAHDMAVVVQRLVRADISGVLFTADPVAGTRMSMTGNYIFGLGEDLVSGEVEPYTFSIQRPRGTFEGAPELKRYAHPLFDMACRLEEDLECPQDIEWAIADGKLYLLQSRPITTLIEHDPTTGHWNSTLTGDYMWSNQIVGEVFPTATTPSTWSVWVDFFNNLSLGDTPSVGNIAGRPYLNYSLMYSFILKLLRSPDRVVAMVKDSVGVPPEGLEIPPMQVSWKALLTQVLPREIKNGQTKKKLLSDAAEYLPRVRQQCGELEPVIGVTESPDALIRLWIESIRPLWHNLHILQDGVNESLEGRIRKLKSELLKLMDSDSAAELLTTMSGAGDLASLGPMVGISRLQNGEISRQEYLDMYGHRGPNENELMEPRAREDPDWLDRQLADSERSHVDVEALLAKRRIEFDRLRRELGQQLPAGKARAIGAKLDEIAATNALREAARSELTRIVGVIRVLFLRAGEMSGLGQGIFFLSIDEVIAVLSGDRTAVKYIDTRRETHERARALPPLPTWIKGRFDPYEWAADPNRRSDYYDDEETAPAVQQAGNGIIKGQPGSAGRVEGPVRRIDSPDQGSQLQVGEILVTATTNIGWTPLFPRAAAIVTDIGGSLSHAAIVAREIGIPAVVGCRIASAHLKTGDRVLVDGRRGTVELLHAD